MKLDILLSAYLSVLTWTLNVNKAAYEIGKFCLYTLETHPHKSLGPVSWKSPIMTLTAFFSHDVSGGTLGLEWTWTNLTKYEITWK